MGFWVFFLPSNVSEVRVEVQLPSHLAVALLPLPSLQLQVAPGVPHSPLMPPLSG